MPAREPRQKQPPVNPPRYTPAQMAQALRMNYGNARATARVLGCERHTVLEYCKRHPECQEAREEGPEARVDLAEVKLAEAIEDREGWAIQLALRGQGAKRGHAEKSETTISLDVSKLTDEQLADLAAGKSPLAVLAGNQSQG